MVEFYETETVESTIRPRVDGVRDLDLEEEIIGSSSCGGEQRDEAAVVRGDIEFSGCVYALTGGVAPLMPSIDVTHLKLHPPPDEKVAWQWLPIKSSARKDDLQLYQWMYRGLDVGSAKPSETDS
ncbi:uncharacterized protein LOC108839850 isoform X1 [Raphanus sativus]|uniref:Uncharacterized protein LOC108839850 isoform X1 n=1 Tax=Raphanus sativus TaxID=3726 RepID=A0A9W3DIB3_RAPSA|nr:uncharacterized protein LOC108839850 isoform X1 [Raphanus sativus]